MLRDERKSPYPISPRDRMRAWRMGFLSPSYLLYELDRRDRDPSRYVSDRMRYLRLSQLNAPYSAILHDKLLFGEVFRRHRDVLPETLAYVRRGRVTPRNHGVRVDSVDAIFDALSRRGRLVLKGVRGWGGSSTIVMEDRRGELLLAGSATTRGAARRSIVARGPQILTEYVEQAAYARNVFPDSANSIRIVTMIDDETQKPFLARAVHRFGGRHTRRMDNFTQGGVAALVDPETGRLQLGIRVLPSGRPEAVERHPDTGAEITGLVVPRWRETVERVLAVARDHPYLPYVGWDVVVTDEGIRILEGNSNSGTDILQVHGPLLADPRIRRFYERRGVLS